VTPIDPNPWWNVDLNTGRNYLIRVVK